MVTVDARESAELTRDETIYDNMNSVELDNYPTHTTTLDLDFPESQKDVQSEEYLTNWDDSVHTYSS
jgi:hypothetical protein